MMSIIRYQLSKLANFTGRDARPTFWWFVLIVAIFQFLLSLLASIPMASGMVGGIAQSAAGGADQAAMEAQMLALMSESISSSIWLSVGVSVLGTALLIAALVRRLHDTGKGGWWALIPVATMLISSVMSINAIDDVQAMLANATSVAELQQMEALSARGSTAGLIRWLGLIIAGVLAAMKSQEGPNQFGEAPTVLKP